MALEPTALSDCKWTWMICWEVGLVEVLSAGILGSWSILALVRVSAAEHDILVDLRQCCCLTCLDKWYI